MSEDRARERLDLAECNCLPPQRIPRDACCLDSAAYAEKPHFVTPMYRMAASSHALSSHPPMHLWHSRPRTLPVLWLWSMWNLLIGFLHTAHDPPCAACIASTWATVIPYRVFMAIRIFVWKARRHAAMPH